MTERRTLPQGGAKAPLRIWFGTGAVGWDNLVYGALLVLFIIFLPQGLLDSVLAGLRRAPARVR